MPVEDIIEITRHGGTKVSIQNTSLVAFLDIAIPNGNDSLKSAENDMNQRGRET